LAGSGGAGGYGGGGVGVMVSALPGPVVVVVLAKFYTALRNWLLLPVAVVVATLAPALRWRTYW